MGDSDPPDLLAGLNPSQHEAVTTGAAPLCVLAGAGSGKTRVLTRRIAFRVAEGSADPRHVLALTFTRRAAAELGSRLETLGVRHQVAAGTFHGLAYAQLRRRWAERGERAPALLERKVRVLGPLLPRRPTAAVQPADVAAEIEWAKARMVRPGRYEHEAAAAGRRPPLPAAAVAALYRRYEEEKRRRGLVDFDDLLLACAAALESDAEFAACQRWRFRHLFVDEFQDVNPAQFRLLRAWLGPRSDIFVVGDPNQAVYAWNGADPSYLARFGEHFPGASVVRLDDNYRSSPQILAVAGAVLGGRAQLRAHQPEGPLPTVTSYPTDREEAVATARSVRRRHGAGLPWSAMAVLTRTHAQLVLFEEAFRAAGIPYRVRGSARFLSHPEIRAALDGLRRLGPATPMEEALSDVVSMAQEAAAAHDGGEAAERAANLDNLVRLGREHLAAEPGAVVAGFLSWLTATLRDDEPGGHRTADAVDLATLHAAKGLEWPVVFVAGLEQGLVPIGHAETSQARAEERRLLYVGLTRARRELHCSWAEKRTFGERSLSRSPSPYLGPVEAVVEALAEGRPVADWKAHLADSRARVRAAGGPQVGRNADPEVLEALKSWRAATARASGVPAYVVFHDATLAAVAEARPRDRDALLALPGVGPVKVDRYGDQLISVVAATGG